MYTTAAGGCNNNIILYACKSYNMGLMMAIKKKKKIKRRVCYYICVCYTREFAHSFRFA